MESDWLRRVEAVCGSRDIRLRVMDRYLHLDVAGVDRERFVDGVLNCDGRIGSAALATKETMSGGGGVEGDVGGVEGDVGGIEGDVGDVHAGGRAGVGRLGGVVGEEVGISVYEHF